LTAEESHYAAEGEIISFGWKGIKTRQFPSQNTLDAFNAGYNENQYRLPDPQPVYPPGAPVPTPGPGEEGGL